MAVEKMPDAARSGPSIEYLAGFIDGEGYVGIKKHHPFARSRNACYYERISAGNTNKQIIDMLAARFGGCVYHHGPSKLSARGYWTWEASNKLAREALTELFPYLIVKRPEAAVVLELSKSKTQHTRQFYVCVPPEVTALREDLFQQAKAVKGQSTEESSEANDDGHSGTRIRRNSGQEPVPGLAGI